MQSVVQGLIKFLRVLHNPSSRSSQGEGGTDNQWETDFLSNLFTTQKRSGRCAFANTHANFHHLQPEFLPVFSRFDGQNINPDNPHTEMFPNPSFIAVNTKVECSLAAHSGQHSVYMVLF